MGRMPATRGGGCCSWGTIFTTDGGGAESWRGLTGDNGSRDRSTGSMGEIEEWDMDVWQPGVCLRFL